RPPCVGGLGWGGGPADAGHKEFLLPSSAKQKRSTPTPTRPRQCAARYLRRLRRRDRAAGGGGSSSPGCALAPTTAASPPSRFKRGRGFVQARERARGS